MLDEYMEKQKINYQILKNAIEKNKCSHAYIFESNGNKDTLSFAIAFAKSLLCPNSYTNNINCGKCLQCKRIDNNDFLELKIISPDGLWIKKEQLLELKSEFKVKSLEADKKVYIITDASKLNESSSNSILKFLEEPEDNIVAILIVDNVYKLLSTIRSRCQLISLKTNKDNVDIRDYLDSFSLKYDIEDIINSAIKFIEYLEKNKLVTILNTKKLIFSKFTDREQFILLFEIILLYYQDAVNLKLNRNCNFFKDKISNIVIENNSLNDLCKKITIVLNIKEKIYINANNNLLIDKLIMEVGEI